MSGRKKKVLDDEWRTFAIQPIKYNLHNVEHVKINHKKFVMQQCYIWLLNHEDNHPEKYNSTNEYIYSATLSKNYHNSSNNSLTGLLVFQFCCKSGTHKLMKA